MNPPAAMDASRTKFLLDNPDLFPDLLMVMKFGVEMMKTSGETDRLEGLM
jgi:hypothetical protein